MRKWPVEGPRKECIDDETQFVDKDILTNVLRCKTIFDHLEPEELRKARSKSNPFETIRGGFFLNRAAMKMANMDAVFDFMFSSPSRLQKLNVLILWMNVTKCLYISRAKERRADGQRQPASLLCGRVRGAWRILRVRPLAEKVAVQRIRVYAERVTRL